MSSRAGGVPDNMVGAEGNFLVITDLPASASVVWATASSDLSLDSGSGWVDAFRASWVVNFPDNIFGWGHSENDDTYDISIHRGYHQLLTGALTHGDDALGHVVDSRAGTLVVVLSDNRRMVLNTTVLLHHRGAVGRATVHYPADFAAPIDRSGRLRITGMPSGAHVFHMGVEVTNAVDDASQFRATATTFPLIEGEISPTNFYVATAAGVRTTVPRALSISRAAGEVAINWTSISAPYTGSTSTDTPTTGTGRIRVAGLPARAAIWFNGRSVMSDAGSGYDGTTYAFLVPVGSVVDGTTLAVFSPVGQPLTYSGSTTVTAGQVIDVTYSTLGGVVASTTSTTTGRLTLNNPPTGATQVQIDALPRVAVSPTETGTLFAPSSALVIQAPSGQHIINLEATNGERRSGTYTMSGSAHSLEYSSFPVTRPATPVAPQICVVTFTGAPTGASFFVNGTAGSASRSVNYGPTTFRVEALNGEVKEWEYTLSAPTIDITYAGMRQTHAPTAAPTPTSCVVTFTGVPTDGIIYWNYSATAATSPITAPYSWYYYRVVLSNGEIRDGQITLSSPTASIDFGGMHVSHAATTGSTATDPSSVTGLVRIDGLPPESHAFVDDRDVTTATTSHWEAGGQHVFDVASAMGQHVLHIVAPNGEERVSNYSLSTYAPTAMINYAGMNISHAATAAPPPPPPPPPPVPVAPPISPVVHPPQIIIEEEDPLSLPHESGGHMKTALILAGTALAIGGGVYAYRKYVKKVP